MSWKRPKNRLLMFYNMAQQHKGKSVIITAPSGAGKTTIVKQLLDRELGLEFSVSATTRHLRGQEVEGKDYYFLSVDEFRKRIEQNDFAEWEEVYKDHFYGTLKSEIDRIWAKGKHVLFDVDVRGGIKLKKIFGTRSIALFIMPPSVDELKKRLIKRGTDEPAKVDTRLAKAEEELKFANQFDNIIFNDQLDKAIVEASVIVSSFLKT